ncbi:MAG: NAD(P)H-hydrate dehydratase [Lentisphaerae bacterium]|nr:NAD(P)H-hydrate dehydratase [Lentisphaerota bacterium]
MRFVTAATMRNIDRHAIEKAGVPAEHLMEKAGFAVASEAWAVLNALPARRMTVEVLAGRGNNGGDGFVAARHLSAWGARVRVLVAGGQGSLSPDAKTSHARLTGTSVEVFFLPEDSDWNAAADLPNDADVVIDAVLGTGSNRGAPRGVAASAVRRAMRMSGTAKIVAADIPSGMDADTGAAPGDAVTADLTVTLGMPKTGLACPAGLDRSGSVVVGDIGLPPGIPFDPAGELELITPLDTGMTIPRRSRSAHKGDFGRVCIIGGAPGFSGAAALAARAASRAGAGLVSVVTPRSVAGTVGAFAPETMVHGVDTSPSGWLSAEGVKSVSAVISAADSIVVGPGMTAHEETARIVFWLAGIAGKKTVILDADALNVHAGRIGALKGQFEKLVITPHPGEMARMMCSDAAAVQADRAGSARSACEKSGAVVVLKGAGTLVAAPGMPTAINLTGNPGMATGGTGDVLAGLIAGLAAQVSDPRAAAQLGVWIHGRAGDLAAWRKSEAAMVAPDLTDAIPHAFHALCPARQGVRGGSRAVDVVDSPFYTPAP